MTIILKFLIFPRFWEIVIINAVFIFNWNFYLLKISNIP